MDTTKLLEKIGTLFESNTAFFRKELHEMMNQFKIESKITKEELKADIVKSQEDTIAALTEVINEGYQDHEKRIIRLEKQLHSSHIQ